MTNTILTTLKPFSALVAAALLCSCSALYTRHVTFDDHPIAVRVNSTVVDEEDLDYKVTFRNIGTQVISFDYTVADQPGVPHIDQHGPNSGLVKNLYPGAEVVIPNPKNTLSVWVTLGTVTYGKKDEADLLGIYDPEAAVAADQGSMPGIDPDNPLL